METKYSVDKALDDMGGFGYHQKKVSFLFMIMMSAGSYVTYPLGFYERKPLFTCFDGGVWRDCDKTQYCNQDSKLPNMYSDHHINYTNKHTLYNWQQQFDVICENHGEIPTMRYLVVCLFAGMGVGNLIMPILSDRFGRKLICLIGCFIHVAAGVTLIFTTNYKAAFSVFILQGFGFTARLVVGYIWFIENIPKTYVATVSCIIFIFDSFASGVTLIYFYEINKDWRFIYGAPLILVFLSALAMLCFNDSPKYYQGIRSYDRAKEVLTKIGHSNYSLNQDETFSENLVEVEAREDSFFDDSDNVYNLVLFVGMNMCTMFIHYLLKDLRYLIDMFDLVVLYDVYTIVNTVIEIVAYILTIFVAKYLQPNFAFAVLYSISLLMSVLSFFAFAFDIMDAAVPYFFIIMKLCIAMTFALLMFTPMGHFKAKHYGLVMGLSQCTGRLSTIVVPMIAGMGETVPMILCAILSMIAGFFAFLLQRIDYD